tara:strand:- start:4386 stop:5039 length:654 start_codon:yes stop_codon:yes gene_type:complete
MALVLNGSNDTITGLQINSANIVDGSIVNADINDLAASKLTGALPAISGANLTGISTGITEADIWRLTQDVQASQGSLSTLTAWERSDDAESTFIGTGMTYDSSGEYFHFPSTGKWLINVSLVLYGQYAFGWGFIATQFRGSGSSSYDGVAAAWANVSANGGYGGGFSQCLVDVTESGSSGARVYFDQQAVSTAGRFIHGSTTQNRTSLAFIRLGDT